MSVVHAIANGPILTRNMSEGVPLVLEDVMQEIVTLVVNRTVGAAGIALSGPGRKGIG